MYLILFLVLYYCQLTLIFFYENYSEIRAAQDFWNCEGEIEFGDKILKAGGLEKIFKNYFSVREGEKMLKASQCYLSTTTGPIAGLLFISTDKLAFCSERSIKLSSPTGEIISIRYKVSHNPFFFM